MVAGAAAQLQQQGPGVLGHVVHAVGHYVADRDAVCGGVGSIDDVVTCGQDGHHTQVGQAGQRARPQGDLVGDQHFRAGGPFHDQVFGRIAVDGHLAQFFQGRPADVAGVDDVAVKHNYLHVDPCCAHCKTGRQCLHGLLPGQAGEEKGAVAAFSGAV